jgi:regulator of sigma E protease
LLVLETAVALILTLAVLVVAHEFGHFSAAKLVGVRVDEFAFGFGPKLIRLCKLGDTEYTIHPIPAGGFVKLAGMEPGEDEDDPRGFNAQSIWKRFVIIFAGPFMSFVLAYVVFCSLGATIGLPVPGMSQNVIGEVKRGSPADQAGLQIGDRIVAINGLPIKNGRSLQDIVFKSANRELTLRVQRDHRVLTAKATPKLEKLEGKTVGLLGLLLEPPKQRYSVRESIVQGTWMTGRYLQEMFKALTTKVGLKQVGGVIGITRVTAEGVKHGPEQVIFQLAALSLTLAVINLLPWPILDGGHILLLVLEAIRRRKLTPHQMQVFQAFGLATLIALALFLVYVDLSKWVPLDRPLMR